MVCGGVWWCVAVVGGWVAVTCGVGVGGQWVGDGVWWRWLLARARVCVCVCVCDDGGGDDACCGDGGGGDDVWW